MVPFCEVNPMDRDLTKGPVTSSMLLFALPMIVGNLLQQCYNIADTLIVGRFLGQNALAAVGTSFSLMTFLTSILLGMCMGSGALFSMRFGQRNETAIIAEGVRYLRIEGAFYCGIGCLFLLYGLYRALGRPGFSVVLTVVSLGTRVALAYLLSAIPAVGVVGIWWSVPVGWFLADAVGLIYYFKKVRGSSA